MRLVSMHRGRLSWRWKVTYTGHAIENNTRTVYVWASDKTTAASRSRRKAAR